MNEPKRLRSGEGPASLLASSLRGDRLDDDAKRRMRAALGLGVAPVAGAATTAPSGAGGAGAAEPAKIGAAKAGTLAAGANGASPAAGVGAGAVKWGALALAGALVVAGVGLAAKNAPADAPPVVAIPPAPHAPYMAPAVDVPRAVETLPSASAVTPPPPGLASGHPMRVAGSSARAFASPLTSSAVPATDLGEELRLLEDARARLRGGEPSAALASIARYRHAMPVGALQLEANVIEVEALVALGRRDEAVAKGRAILVRQPEGPLSERVRRTIGE